METIILNAESRATGRHASRELRNASRVPAVVYGQGTATMSVSLDRKELGIALHNAGTGLIAIEMAGQPQLKVLVREVQRHPTKHYVQHIDFLAVSMTQKVRLEVPVVAQNTAPALANPDLVLVRGLDSVEIECLPGDIPEHLVADLSKLATVHDEITVSDLAAPTGVKIWTEGGHVVFAITASRAAAVEEAEAEAAAAPAEVEVVTKRKPKEEAEA